MRVLVIGLDGASPVLIQKWIDKLPNIKRLSESGVHGVLQSVVPPASVPAWQCFATGKNPAKIGLFGFATISRRSEEHTSELQSLRHLVCRLLLEKKNLIR